MVDSTPLVSYIVASYNYEKFIGKTIRSILDQTMDDLEIVVIDDESSDLSRDVVRSFDDSRIRFYVNDRNMGPAWTYNRGTGLARGTYVTCLDSDDWIEPQKTEQQLDYFRRYSGVDIVGTYVKIFDKDGNRHPYAEDVEKKVNQPRDLDRLETWIDENYLSAPSVMFARALHDRIGLRDATMIRASDYELWTRACAHGCRFGVLPIPMLDYRWHGDNASSKNVKGSFLEKSYAFQRNISPTIKDRATSPLMRRMIDWIVTHEQFTLLSEGERYQLLACVLTSQPITPFGAFRAALDDAHPDPKLVSMVRRYCIDDPLRPSA
jgi:glycosyltransferase involved in cell wall biosynthesis